MRVSMYRQLLGVVLACVMGAAQAEPITPAGAQMAAVIDALDVEHHWPMGQHVSWQTGVPDGRPETAVGRHTHCSAFAAAAAKRLGVYLLRPPEHPQLLLANAQYDWLAGAGAAKGWTAIHDGVEAQRAANQGRLVVAVYKNHMDDKPGHIAIVRPSEKSDRAIQEEGPQVTQAGGTNYHSVALREGFAGHPLAWTHHEVMYYGHALDPSVVNAK